MLTHPIDETLDFVYQDGQFFCIKVSLTIYQKETILKAAYQFTNTCYIHIDPIGEETCLIRVRAKEQGMSSEALAREFCNALIDQELRATISQQTEAVRNLIMAHAFSETALIEPEFEDADYIADPLQITQSDEK